MPGTWWNKETISFRMKRWQMVVVIVVLVLLLLVALVRILFSSALLDRAWISFFLRFMVINVFVIGLRCCDPHMGCRIEEILVISGIAICYYYAFFAPFLFPNSIGLDI